MTQSKASIDRPKEDAARTWHCQRNGKHYNIISITNFNSDHRETIIEHIVIAFIIANLYNTTLRESCQRHSQPYKMKRAQSNTNCL